MVRNRVQTADKIALEDWKLAREALADLQDAVDKLTGGNIAVSTLVCEIIEQAGKEAEARSRIGAETWEQAMQIYMDIERREKE